MKKKSKPPLNYPRSVSVTFKYKNGDSYSRQIGVSSDPHLLDEMKNYTRNLKAPSFISDVRFIDTEIDVLYDSLWKNFEKLRAAFPEAKFRLKPKNLT